MELTDRRNYEGTAVDDYLHITLTDEQDIPEALARLRVIYPNLMQLDYDNQRTRQQQEISELKDFVARNKARVSTRNMAMSRQKKLDKMDVIELAAEKPKPEFHFLNARQPEN